MARRGEEEDEIVAGTSFGAAGGTSTLGRASMRPQMLATPSAPDDLQAALSQKTPHVTKLFEVAILLTVVNTCKPVKDASDLLILRETLLEELGPAYMWLIFLSVVEWPFSAVLVRLTHHPLTEGCRSSSVCRGLPQSILHTAVDAPHVVWCLSSSCTQQDAETDQVWCVQDGAGVGFSASGGAMARRVHLA